jgi:Ca-activated chloride channel homolog
LVAAVVVVQRFGNPLEKPAEMDYLFPLPEDAAITAFELRIGDRQVLGNVQESQAARSAYEDARETGKHAGLLEQRRPNLYAVRLANVQPGEVIHATARYQQRLRFEDGVYEFIFPMGITPKYDSPSTPWGRRRHACAYPPDR